MKVRLVGGRPVKGRRFAGAIQRRHTKVGPLNGRRFAGVTRRSNRHEGGDLQAPHKGRTVKREARSLVGGTQRYSEQTNTASGSGRPLA
eukprot:194754-Chlamydomonas_euryale.AAC.6